MWWQLRHFAVNALSLMIALGTFSPAGAQSQGQQHRVTSVIEDAAGKFLLFNTSQLIPLTAPSVQYVPGPDGATVMVLDFHGLEWNQPSKVVFPNVPGIRHVRIGQFEQSPPVCRIAISTSQPQLLKQLAFVASPGALVLKWPAVPGKKPDAVVELAAAVPPVAPPIVKRPPAVQPSVSPVHKKPTTGSTTQPSAPQKHAEPAPRPAPLVVAPPAAQSALHSSPPAAPPIARPKVAPPVVAPQPARQIAMASPMSTAAITPLPGVHEQVKEEVAPPVVTITAGEQVRVEFSGLATNSHRSFRLHDPERYVIDIAGHPEVANAAVPPAPDNPLLKSVRLGNPEGENSTSRIVLDLTGTDVVVRELTENPTMLAFCLERIPAGEAGRQFSMAEPGKIPPGTMIVLDAGHGGSDPGAQRGDIQEKELTLSITEKVRKKLAQAGAKINMTRSDDTFVSLEDRVTITNNVKPDLFLSIHINALEANSAIHGIETYYQTDQSKPLAQAIHDCLVSNLGAPDRSVRRARFYVVNHTQIPAVLAEVGYISNKEERTKLISSDYQEKIADALMRGVMLYLSRRSELLQSGNTANANGTMNVSAQSEKVSGGQLASGSNESRAGE